MKIMHLTTFLDFGGIERKKENIYKWNDENEWLFVAINKGGAAEDIIKQNGKKTICLNLPFRIPTIKTIVGLYNLLKKESPDVLHLAGAEANFFGTIAGRFAKTPLIICEDWGSDNQSRMGDIVFKYIFKFCDFIIAESTLVSQKLIQKYKLSPEKVKTVFNFIDNQNTSFRKPISSVPRIIISVARLVEKKRIDIALRVIKKLKTEGFDINFVILGDGPLMLTLKNQVKNLEMENYVEFKGFVSSPLSEIMKADIYLSTSNNEGFSNALLEAMSCGLVPVVTNVGGVQDVIQHGENGFVTDVSSEQSIYMNLKKVLQTEDSELFDIGKKAVDTINDNFSLEKHIYELMTIYKKCNPQK